MIRMPSFVRALLATALLLAAGSARASLLPVVDPDPAVPSPASFLGHEPGERFTPHHRIVAYCEALAAASDRVALVRYGETYEGRPLLHLVISDPGNVARQDELRDAYARLADPRSLDDDAARALVTDLPVAVWLSFGIHGNESSSSEAALAVAYHLAAERDPAVRDLLRDSVVLLDPCLNPDGRDRYVNWYRGQRGASPDPDPVAREHDEPWPGGRYNHYLFDLNRDWAWLTQSESRARAKAYLAWHPQVHVDLHEMWPEATYFFFPPERPVHTEYPPQVVRWTQIFGQGNARAFDERGWRYYTAESFDLFYPGYGDSWPTFQGAIGMTYEQAGHGVAGASYRREDGTVLTLAERAEHHAVAALATVRTAAERRTERLLDFREFFEPTGRGAYLFPPGDDPPRTAQLMGLLQAHGAEVSVTTESVSRRGLKDHDGKDARTDLPAGTYVVDLEQPLHRFLRAVLEPEAELPDTLFYDLSAWSLPSAFGVETYHAGRVPGADRELLDAPPTVEGRLENPGATYAFLVDWRRNGAPAAAARLQAAGIRLHAATRAFTLDGRRFGPGTLVAFREGNPDLDAVLPAVVRECGVEAFGVDTGLTEEGPDLGSSRVRPLPRARIALVADDPAAPTSVGPCWYLLDRVYALDHSLIRTDAVTDEGLRDFDVIVFPDDYTEGRRWEAALDSSQIDALSAWVRRGGVFVGLGGGAFLATADRAALATVKIADPLADLDEDEKKEREEERKTETVAEREKRRNIDAVPGTIFRVAVDPDQPLGFGYAGEVRVLRTSDTALELGPAGSNVARFTDEPRVSGYAPEEDVRHIAGSPFLVDERLGAGHVVLYVEDPNFRLFWYGLTRMFLNSLFFLPEVR